tara:strand:+ start:57 stop:425 length:369 start_codon:yes stop_codon:yes gene_type:complete
VANITLRRHLTKAGLDPNLVYLIEDIASSCRVVANTVRNGAFEGNLGSADAINVQGKTQKTLDILDNDIFSASAGSLAQETEAVLRGLRTVWSFNHVCADPWRTGHRLYLSAWNRRFSAHPP